MKKPELQNHLDRAVDSDGPVYAKITTETQVIWVEVTGVKENSLLDPPWRNGVIELDTKPIPEGVGARMTRPDVYMLPGGVWVPIPKSPPQPSPEAIKAVEALPDATIPAGTMFIEHGPELVRGIPANNITIHGPLHGRMLHGRMYEDDTDQLFAAPLYGDHRPPPIVIPNVNPEHEDPAESHYGDIVP